MKTNRYLKRTDLLTEVRDCIINNPQRFTYQMWFNGGPTYQATGKQMQCNDNWCGTMACVAGHVIALSCPPEVPIFEFMKIDGVHLGEANAANSILEVDELYEYAFKKFLYSPWYWKDRNGNRLIMEVDRYRELAIKEAVRRINWILDDKPLYQYEIDEPALIEPQE